MSTIRLFLLGAALAAAPLSAQQLDTGDPSGGTIASNGFGQLNPSQASLIGQTFVAPQYAQLDRFSFHLFSLRSFESVAYRAFVAAYDGATNSIVGPVLWQSAARAGTASFLPEETTFEIDGGLAVLPGARYIAFLGIPGIAGSSTQVFGAAARAASLADAQFAGKVATAYPGTVASYGMMWSPAPSNFAFRAEFSNAATPVSTVPEPATVGLLGLGLAATGAVARRRTIQR